MPITIDATHEDGLLKPAEPLPLQQHDKVRLTVEGPVVPPVGQTTNLAGWFSSIEVSIGALKPATEGRVKTDRETGVHIWVVTPCFSWGFAGCGDSSQRVQRHCHDSDPVGAFGRF